MSCRGSAQLPVTHRRRWADRERFAVEQVCRVCGKRVTVRKDGKVRKHEPPARPVVEVQVVPRPARRVVTQK